jgi:hypothetical protein
MSTAPKATVVNARGEPATAAQGFAAWLEKNEPDLFQALLKHAAAGKGLGDWSSILSDVGSIASSIGSDIGSAATSVGDYLTSSQGLQTLSSLASTYLSSQTQQSVTQMQLDRAQQGLAPAPVSYATNAAGQVVPFYTASSLPSSIVPYASAPVTDSMGNTGYPLSSQGIAALSGTSTSTLQKYLPYILIGGAALLVFSFMGKK